MSRFRQILTTLVLLGMCCEFVAVQNATQPKDQPQLPLKLINEVNELRGRP